MGSNKYISLILFIALAVVVGCGVAEGTAGEGKVINGEGETKEPASIKYFEPNAGPSGGEGFEIHEGEIEGRPYLMVTYDENGNLLSESFYDENGDKCFGPNEWNSMIHRYEYTYNESGQETSETTLGMNGEPVASYLPPGKYRSETYYNEDGEILYGRWLYLDGKIREFTPDGEGGLNERVYRADE